METVCLGHSPCYHRSNGQDRLDTLSLYLILKRYLYGVAPWCAVTDLTAARLCCPLLCCCTPKESGYFLEHLRHWALCWSDLQGEKWGHIIVWLYVTLFVPGKLTKKKCTLWTQGITTTKFPAVTVCFNEDDVLRLVELVVHTLFQERHHLIHTVQGRIQVGACLFPMAWRWTVTGANHTIYVLNSQLEFATCIRYGFKLLLKSSSPQVLTLTICVKNQHHISVEEQNHHNLLLNASLDKTHNKFHV